MQRITKLPLSLAAGFAAVGLGTTAHAVSVLDLGPEFTTATVSYDRTLQDDDIIGTAAIDSRTIAFSTTTSLFLPTTTAYTGPTVYGGVTILNTEDNGAPAANQGEQKANNGTPDQLRWRGDSNNEFTAGAFLFDVSGATSWDNVTLFAHEEEQNIDADKSLLVQIGNVIYISEDFNTTSNSRQETTNAATIAALTFAVFDSDAAGAGGLQSGDDGDLRFNYGSATFSTLASLGVSDQEIVRFGYFAQEGDDGANGIFLSDLELAGTLIPEPASLALLGLGSLLILGGRKRSA